MDDIKDLNSRYQKQRENLLAALKDAIDGTPELSTKERDVLNQFLVVLEQFSFDIDSAHNRIYLRKTELQKLSYNITSLSNALSRVVDGLIIFEDKQNKMIIQLSENINELAKGNRRFMTVTSVIGIVIVCLCTVIMYGGREVFSSLSYITTVLKLLQTFV